MDSTSVPRHWEAAALPHDPATNIFASQKFMRNRLRQIQQARNNGLFQHSKLFWTVLNRSWTVRARENALKWCHSPCKSSCKKPCKKPCRKSCFNLHELRRKTIWYKPGTECSKSLPAPKPVSSHVVTAKPLWDLYSEYYWISIQCPNSLHAERVADTGSCCFWCYKWLKDRYWWHWFKWITMKQGTE